MAAAVGFSFTPVASVTAKASPVVALHFTFSALGTLGAPPLPIIPADRFTYTAQLSPALQGRYVGDPTIGRMAQRLRRNKRW